MVEEKEIVVLNQKRYSSDEDEEEDFPEVPMSSCDTEEINFLKSLDTQLKKVQQQLFVARAKISSRQRNITELHKRRTKRRKVNLT